MTIKPPFKINNQRGIPAALGSTAVANRSTVSCVTNCSSAGSSVHSRKRGFSPSDAGCTTVAAVARIARLPAAGAGCGGENSVHWQMQPPRLTLQLVQIRHDSGRSRFTHGVRN
jgi:hypothetical protein